MADPSLSCEARVLYFLIDDACTFYWRTERAAAVLGVSRREYYRVRSELLQMELVGLKRTGRESVLMCHPWHISCATHGTSDVPKSAQTAVPVLITEPVPFKQGNSTLPKPPKTEGRNCCAQGRSLVTGGYCHCIRGQALEREERARKRRAR